MTSCLNYFFQKTGGTHGKANISIQYTPITASSNTDYRTTVNYVIFDVGQNRSFIDIQFIDDTLPENQETFSVDLRSIVHGKSQLSNITRLTVTIETSDNPNGLIGLFNMSDYVIQNPLTNRRLPFKVQRLAGNVGSIQVNKSFILILINNFFLLALLRYYLPK